MADNATVVAEEAECTAEVEATFDGNGTQEETNSATVTSTEQDDTAEEKKNDPYAYLQRDEFSSENFKIEIRGLPKFYGLGQLKKLLNNKLCLNAHKVKPPRLRSPWIFVCFKSEADRQKALSVLHGYKWKNCTLSAEPAKAVADPLVKRRRDAEGSEEATEAKRLKLSMSLEEQVQAATIPLWNMPLEEQLEQKVDNMKKVLRVMARQLQESNSELRGWVESQKEKYDGMVCPLEPIRQSPVEEGYRNKCEFTVGLNPKTDECTVGFRVASYKEGSMGVGPPGHLCHLPQPMKNAVAAFEQFVRASDKPPYNPETHEGYWRQLTVRTSRNGDLLLVVVVHPQAMTKEEVAAMKEDVKTFFTEGDGKTCGVTALYFQAFAKKEADSSRPTEHVWGQTHIQEQLGDLRFRVSPEAFFQVNAAAAEVLYSTVGELANVGPDTALLDICCGTGTIGISLAKNCAQVMGVEMVPQAVEDARHNAKDNGISNCQFFVGKAEQMLGSIISWCGSAKVVAVVDPPRPGLHQKVLMVLRKTDRIEHLVFLSCDPRAALKNFVDMGRQTSGTFKGVPFVPEKAVPVDMFPHTAHCELAILFRRATPEDFQVGISGGAAKGEESTVEKAGIPSWIEDY